MKPCAFETLFSKSVPHIMEKIFLSLDYESFKKCQSVSKAWNELLISKSLLQKAKNVFQEEIKDDQEKLWFASRDGKIKEVRRLLGSRMVDVNMCTLHINNVRWTPLHMASVYGRKVVVQLLLNAGAECGKEDDEERTPLHLAAENNHPHVVNILLDAGADPNTEDYDGYTPLHAAASKSHHEECYKYVIQLLVKRGANPRKKNKCGLTPSHSAQCRVHAPHCIKDIKKILSKGHADNV